MEYREPGRFDFVRTTGRLDLRRLLAALLLLVSVAVVVVYLGRQAVDSAIGWLQSQPRYQLRFDEIQLVTPPPDWFRGGRRPSSNGSARRPTSLRFSRCSSWSRAGSSGRSNCSPG